MKISFDDVEPRKITRSKARHLRRKRLILARRAAENNLSNASKEASVGFTQERTVDRSQDRSDTEVLTKSKGRRLRNKKKSDLLKHPNQASGSISDSDNSKSVDCCDSSINILIHENNKYSQNFYSVEVNDVKSCSNDLSLLNNKLEENPSKDIKVTSSKKNIKKVSSTKEESHNHRVSVDLNGDRHHADEHLVESEKIDTTKTVSDNSGKSNINDKQVEEISINVRERPNSDKIIEFAVKPNNQKSIDQIDHKFIKDIKNNLLPASVVVENKMNPEQKTREQIKAEREAKKAAKAAAKSKAKLETKLEKKEVREETAKNAAKVEKIVVQSEKVKIENTPVVKEVLRIEAKKVPSVPVKESAPEVKQEASTEGKSKAELRAERRMKQEAQRAAKQATLSQKNKPKLVESPKSIESASKISELGKKIVRKPIIKENPHEVNLFKHLYPSRESSLINVPTLNCNIHPAIVRLGVQYANKIIVGSNARCVALLAAVQQLVKDFERPSQADFTRGLEASLQECVAYLHHCRPLAVSMHNALKHIKGQMTRLPSTISDNEAKTVLGNAIDTYIQEQIHLADKAISITIQTKISNGDVILTYGYSSLIHKILCDAHTIGRQFRVVIVDGRPWLEGKELLRRLAKHGIECSYILINALSFIMPEVSKVFLGAHAILANGAVMSRAGTAQVALMAKAFNIPVLVACETHKSCERVQTDSIVYNEIGDADELTHNLLHNSKKSFLANWRTKKSLNLLNLTYDVTPADLVTAVVTELAILPCTSVPVILRIKPTDI
ncbi:translation initiation factor eIF-2B subunit delta isoform X2 [Cephus cinctus]|uniref:Translation initiation factor eIF2B subunit delta n=1 Tax=Cephus cinctus TaxID=211228 RepID=A0AAJ7BJC4_CEPCN|nr:translation initiation factor eIF-2B subunit delta isoform X2 [Cephus cinctus]